MSKIAIGLVAFLGVDAGAGAVAWAGEGRRPGFGKDEEEEENAKSAESAEDAEDGEPDYRFEFHGYLRIPMRAGFGDGKINSPPHIPDLNYTDWSYTNLHGGPWTELWFTYGDKTVRANVVIEAYDVSQASYRNLQAQLGVGQAFLSLDFPTLFGPHTGLHADVGAFVGRYGMAGQYDAGRYDTYLFGATHTAGETLALSWRPSADYELVAEHGVGGKVEVAPIVPGLAEAPFLPYPGDVQQGSTFLHHAHLSLTWKKQLTLGLHHMIAFTADSPAPDQPDGSIATMGAELKLTGSRFGEGYLGFAHLASDEPLRVAGALETVHSFEGWNLRDNYFGADATGSGTVDTLLFEYTFSLATWLWHPEEFWGQAPDLRLSIFGMYNAVASDDPLFTGAASRLKMGAEVAWQPKAWLTAGLRYDLVQPDLADNTRSFQVISPSIAFSSRFASNEQLTLTWSHYVNGDSVTPAYPSEALPADGDVVRLAASMWW